ncbi:MAG: pyrimidine/purine nucleoside phosphorylase [Pseudomonadota bacterium]
MSKFENVTVLKEASVYFGGKVTSRTVMFADGSKKTLGIMMPGEYEFPTELAENMEMQSGDVEVLLPGETEWKAIPNGTSFDVAANSKFGIKVKHIADFCCSYIAA